MDYTNIIIFIIITVISILAVFILRRSVAQLQYVSQTLDALNAKIEELKKRAEE